MNNLYIYRLSMIVLIYRTTKIKRYCFVAMLLNVASAVLIYSRLKGFLIPKDKSMYAWDMQVCKCVLQTRTGVIWRGKIKLPLRRYTDTRGICHGLTCTNVHWGDLKVQVQRLSATQTR